MASIISGSEKNERRLAEIADDSSMEGGDIDMLIGNPFGVGRTITSGNVAGMAGT